MTEQFSGLRHCIRIGMLSVQTPFGHSIKTYAPREALFDLQVKAAIKEHQHWMTEHFSSTTAQKWVVGQITRPVY